MATMIMYVSGCLCVYLVMITIKFINSVWWNPNRIQSLMRSQGIKGPSYRFLYGSLKEMLELRKSILRDSSGISHHTFQIIQPHFYSWSKIYGRNFLSWHGTRAQLIVSEPELIKEILNNKDGAYVKMEAKGLVKDLLGEGLIMSRGEKWFKMRKLANHAFFAESLKNMTPAMIESVGMMLRRWRQHEAGKDIDVFQEFKILTSEIISRTAFGSSYLEGQRIFNMLSQMIVNLFRSNYKPKIPVIGKFVKSQEENESEKLEQKIRDSIMKIIKKREEDAMFDQLGGSYGSDFLGLLLKAYHETDETKKISIDELIDECKTIYVAGQETSASLLSWIVLLLAIHKDWQEKTRNEVLELFGRENPTSDGINRLKTMGMVVNESLRLYSPAVIITRIVEKEVRLGEIIIPAMTEINISPLAMHHNPEIWGQDVHQFKPERFADGVARATNDNTIAFFPFGLGHRTCVGSNFAIVETKIALSMILQHFRFTLSPNYVHSPMQLLTMTPQHGVQVILQPLL